MLLWALAGTALAAIGWVLLGRMGLQGNRASIWFPSAVPEWLAGVWLLLLPPVVVGHGVPMRQAIWVVPLGLLVWALPLPALADSGVRALLSKGMVSVLFGLSVSAILLIVARGALRGGRVTPERLARSQAGILGVTLLLAGGSLLALRGIAYKMLFELEEGPLRFESAILDPDGETVWARCVGKVENQRVRVDLATGEVQLLGPGSFGFFGDEGGSSLSTFPRQPYPDAGEDLLVVSIEPDYWGGQPKRSVAYLDHAAGKGVSNREVEWKRFSKWMGDRIGLGDEWHYQYRFGRTDQIRFRKGFGYSEFGVWDPFEEKFFELSGFAAQGSRISSGMIYEVLVLPGGILLWGIQEHEGWNRVDKETGELKVLEGWEDTVSLRTVYRDGGALFLREGRVQVYDSLADRFACLEGPELRLDSSGGTRFEVLPMLNGPALATDEIMLVRVQERARVHPRDVARTFALFVERSRGTYRLLPWGQTTGIVGSRRPGHLLLLQEVPESRRWICRMGRARFYVPGLGVVGITLHTEPGSISPHSRACAARSRNG
ncbi:MAG: hypothetical protein R3F33_06385 [Planctomycetota bacterium]